MPPSKHAATSNHQPTTQSRESEGPRIKPPNLTRSTLAAQAHRSPFVFGKKRGETVGGQEERAYAVVPGADDGEELEHAPELLLVHGRSVRACEASSPAIRCSPAMWMREQTSQDDESFPLGRPALQNATPIVSSLWARRLHGLTTSLDSKRRETDSASAF